jgi:hypothetical protein
MSAKSRNKGASFERDIARQLEALLGIKFERNLEQVRTAAHGDLVPNDPAFPFSCELKRYASGISCLTAWKDQSSKAAAMCGKIPAVIFKFDRQPVRVAVPLACLTDGKCDNPAEWAEITLEGFAYVAREIMAAKVLK